MAEEKQMLTQITFSDLSELEDANAEEDLDEIEDEEAVKDEYGRAYCICKIPDAEDIKACQGKSCSTKWYHFMCVGLRTTTSPKKWICQQCIGTVIYTNFVHISSCSYLISHRIAKIENMKHVHAFS